MKTVIWEPETIRHLSHTWEAFQSLVNEQVLIIDGRKLVSVRKMIGWPSAPIDNLNHVLLDKREWWEHGKFIIDQNKNAIHIFVGFWTIRQYFPIILYGLQKNVKIVIINEPYSPIATFYNEKEAHIYSWLKMCLRPLIYKFFAFCINYVGRKKLPCILAISSLAEEQFRKVGFEETTIFPFGYFINKDNIVIKKTSKSKKELRIIFIGGLIERKGVDLLIAAIGKINENKIRVTLDIYGFGEIERTIPKDSKAINYLGVIPQNIVQSTISQYDLLVLPSRHDGWGVVVNEALLQGIPVITSDRVGAKCLFESSGAGIIFESDNVDSLVEKIELVLEPDVYKKIKASAIQIDKKITSDVAAKYIYDLIQYYFYSKSSTYPQAIWKI